MDSNKFCWWEWETCKTKTKGMKGWHLPGGQISLNKSNDILNLSVVFSSTMTKYIIFMLILAKHVLHTYMAECCLFSLCYIIGKTKQKFLTCMLTFEFFLILVLLLTKKQFLNNYNFSYLLPLSAMISRTMFLNKNSQQLIKILNWIFHIFNQNLIKIFKGIFFKKSRVIHAWLHTLDMLQCTD